MLKKGQAPITLAAIVVCVVIVCGVVAYVALSPSGPEKEVKWATIAGFYSDWAEEISADFTEETGIEVKVIGLDYSVLYEKQMLELAGKTGAFDIVTIETMCLAEWANAGWLEPLDSYIAETPTEEIQYEDILEHYRWLLSWGGACYALPYYTYDQGVIYRADLFEDEEIKTMYRDWTGGLELKKPSAEMTWDEAIKVAEFFDEVVPDDIMPYGIGLMAGPAESNDEWMAIMWGLGGHQFDKDYNITVGEEEPVRAMEIYLELLEHASPGALASSYDEVVAQMQAGQIPMTGPFYLDQWPNAVKTEGLISGAKMGCDTPIGGRGYVGCFALGLGAASKNKDAAWEFLKWITGPEGQYSFAKGGGTTCRKSVLLNPEFDPEKNPATRPFTGHYKSIVETSNLLMETTESWEQPYRIFKLPTAGTMYLESKVSIGSIAAGMATPQGGLDALALAYATVLGWGYPVPSLSPPDWWVPPPE